MLCNCIALDALHSVALVKTLLFVPTSSHLVAVPSVPTVLPASIPTDFQTQMPLRSELLQVH